MLSRRPVDAVCLSCRLRLLAQQQPRGAQPSLRFASTLRSREKRATPLPKTKSPSRRTIYAGVTLSGGVRTEAIPFGGANQVAPSHAEASPEQNEAAARNARQRFGDEMPEGILTKEETKVYERLYGRPTFVSTTWKEEQSERGELATEVKRDGKHMLLRQNQDGDLEEVEYTPEAAEEDAEESGDKEDAEANDMYNFGFEEGLQGMEELEAMRAKGIKSDPLRPSYDFARTHSLTEAGRSRTWPTTVTMAYRWQESSTMILNKAKNRHLAEKAHETFGGANLPLSVATPGHIPSHQIHLPVAMDASEPSMTNLEADIFLATMVPGLHASAMSVLVEVRKRLGSGWIEELVRKPGGPVVLDAGAGGAGIMAWQEILGAEWSRLREEHDDLAAMDENPPSKQVVITGSDTLRYKISKILDNTQFLPRLPETIFPWAEETGPEPRKLYDVIIAPHNLLGIREDYVRKRHVQRLWSLLNPDGGVLIIMEKGLPRGFEVIGAARQMLLERHIADPLNPEPDPQYENRDRPTWKKEIGMIVAPCTNHVGCPMQPVPGEMVGRKDFCYFSQRFTRPAYLRNIVGVTHQNHEDIQFSYIAVQRGRDHRRAEFDTHKQGVVQGADASDKSFLGYEHLAPSPSLVRNPDDDVVYAPYDLEDAEEAFEDMTISDEIRAQARAPPAINTLSLPRLILKPLKRRGHVTLDVCTPAGTLDRWTVPQSYSKQAYRDARKSSWGDLWALGAKTRVPKNVRTGRPKKGYGHADVRGQGRGVKRGGHKRRTDVYEVTDTGEVRLENPDVLDRKATRREKRAVRDKEREIAETAAEARREVLVHGELGKMAKRLGPAGMERLERELGDDD